MGCLGLPPGPSPLDSPQVPLTRLPRRRALLNCRNTGCACGSRVPFPAAWGPFQRLCSSGSRRPRTVPAAVPALCEWVTGPGVGQALPAAPSCHRAQASCAVSEGCPSQPYLEDFLQAERANLNQPHSCSAPCPAACWRLLGASRAVCAVQALPRPDARIALKRGGGWSSEKWDMPSQRRTHALDSRCGCGVRVSKASRAAGFAVGGGGTLGILELPEGPGMPAAKGSGAAVAEEVSLGGGGLLNRKQVTRALLGSSADSSCLSGVLWHTLPR